MNNLDFFPFERNRYYYGKLLSVNDFQLEQRYMNDKRRVINRLSYGTGVLCGLKVQKVENDTISLSSGIALDFSGREIVVDKPVIKKLSSIDGFNRQDNITKYYLCIEYVEKKIEALHSITSSDTIGNSEEYNKYEEGYRLFLMESLMPENINTLENFYKISSMIYSNAEVSITQSTPSIIAQNSNIELQITIEKNTKLYPIKFEYELHFTCLKNGEMKTLKVEFNEENYAKSNKYVISYNLSVMSVNNDFAILNVVPNSFKVSVASIVHNPSITSQMKIPIVENDAEGEIIQSYYDNAMEKVFSTENKSIICLAKFNIINAGLSYFIDEIERMPFKQYVLNNDILTIKNRLINSKLRKLKSAETQISFNNNEDSGSEQVKQKYSISDGVIEIKIPSGGKIGQRFFSSDICHGLGTGNVLIEAGLMYNTSSDSPVIYGSSEIFNDSDCDIKAEIAVKLNPLNGKFKVGIRLLEIATVQTIQIHWTALRNNDNIQTYSNEKHLYIKPSMIDLKVMDTFYFDVEYENMADKRIKWSVKQLQGGTINNNGMYTAPNIAGVYEVMAESEEYTEVKALAYVVVRE